jgi:putative cell wall-binding protein
VPSSAPQTGTLDHAGRPPLPFRRGAGAVCAVALLAAALSGCSLKAGSNGGSSGAPAATPAKGAKSSDKQAVEQLGFPVTATRNTTRVSGSDATADAAGVASALFPASALETRPPAVVLVDKDDWQAAVAAGALVAAPLRAPILLTDGSGLAPVTADTLARLKPKGASLARNAQTILIGSKPGPPKGLRSAAIRASDPYSLAVAIDKFSSVAKGRPSGDVVVASGEQPQYSIPAAAWAARSGDAVLFTKRDSLPAVTQTALKEHQQPNIYVLGPVAAVSKTVEKQLGKFGKVTRIEGANPVDNAIAFARFKHGGFGWGAVVPGQNLTIANVSRPGDAAAAAGLAANGVFAPLLLTDSATLPQSLESYLLDLQPGFQGGDPSQGVYNHVWILGGADALSPASQDQVDAAAALVPVDQPAGR